MISKTFSNKWVVYKGDLKRFKWFGILYGVILFLQLPLFLWMELSKQKFIQGSLGAEVANKSLRPEMIFQPIEHLINIVVPITFGLILFNYLQNDRASTLFHSLPIKRGFLYCQNLLAGLTLIWLPILINEFLMYGVMTAFGVTEVQWQIPQVNSSVTDMVNSYRLTTVPVWQIVSFSLIISLLMTGLFYIFTVFIGMLTGNVLLQGALTFIGLFLPMGLYVIVKLNLAKLLYGFSGGISDRILEWLSPIVNYLNNQNYMFLFKTWTWYMWYFGTAVLLCGASIYLYKIRHAEAAGETLAGGWMRWIFKYGVAICAALTSGLYFSGFNENYPWILYLGYFIGGLLGYIIADMIAYKSFHFYQRWKGMVIFGAVFILLLSFVKMDFYGYQSYVPAQNEVKEVFLSNLNRESFSANKGLTGKDNINVVRLLHRQIINLEDENTALEKSSKMQNTTTAVKPFDPQSRVLMDITYVLNNGSKVTRTYFIDLKRYRQFLVPIFNSREAKMIMFGRLFNIDRSKIDQINVTNNRTGKGIRIYKRAEIDEALAALRKDVLNVSYEAAVEGKVPPQANLDFVSKIDADQRYNSYALSYYPEFKNLEAFLAEHNYQKDLFLNPEDISAVIVKNVNSDKTTEIKDKQTIKDLINWGNLDNENVFITRKPQPENKEMVQYSGKIVLKKGSPIYVMFDGSYYAQQFISRLVSEK